MYDTSITQILLLLIPYLMLILLFSYVVFLLYSQIGHLIYELTSGYELSTSKPSEQDLAIMKYAEIREVLKFIFYNEERVVPSIEEVSD